MESSKLPFAATTFLATADLERDADWVLRAISSRAVACAATAVNWPMQSVVKIVVDPVVCHSHALTEERSGELGARLRERHHVAGRKTHG